MTTLSTIIQGTYKKLGQYNAAILTSGTNQTAIDTKLTAKKYKGNEWLDGLLMVERTTDTLAPQGEFQRISSYVNAAGTFTVDTVFTAALGAGDVVGYVSGDYPYLMMINWVNDALRSLGPICLIDTASVTPVTGTNEYSLPAAWTDEKPYRIDIQTYIASPTTRNDWVQIPTSSWEFIPPATIAAQAKIIFSVGLVTTSHALRFWYPSHPTVTLYNDTISDTIDPELLILATAEAALEWYNAANSGGDEYVIGRLNEIRQLKKERKESYPVVRPHKQTKTLPIP